MIASSVPGARLIAAEADRLRGEMIATLGPIRAHFAGEASVTYDDINHAGRIVGQGSR